MFFKRVTLFRFFGFDVKADASWIFLSIFISWTLSSNLFPALFPGYSAQSYELMGVMTLAGLLFSIIAHEVAHGVIAEYYHMPIASITLFIFGGVAEMKGEPSHAKGEFFMAIAGPVMSALLGLFFWAAAHLASGIDFFYRPLIDVMSYLGDLNMLIAAFNMVPAFPLDGGRALRAVIWKLKNNLVLATRISSQMGAVFAYALMAFACYRIVLHDDLMGGVWMALLGLFVHGSGTYAVRQIESRALLGMERVMRFAHQQIVAVTPDMTIAQFVDLYVYKHYQTSFPVIDRGNLAGLITLQGVLALDRAKWHWLHVGSVMEPVSQANTISPETSAADALDLMQRKRKASLLIARGQTFMGVVDYSDLATYLSITMKIDHNKPVETSR